MNFKPTFFSADWHIGHAKSIEYDERPFVDLYEMHETLIRRYNATVPPNGICYFLGDMGNKNEDIKAVINRLHGTKVLALGNHDKGINTMYNCGFDVVLHSAAIFVGEHKVTMSHCPLPGIKREDTSGMKSASLNENWHGERKNVKFVVPNEGQFHLSGHIHSRKGKATSKKILDKQYDVGVPGNSYTPVSLSVIESWIALYLKSQP